MTPQELGLSKAAYSPKSVCRLLDISLPTVHRLAASGELKRVKIGRKTVFTADDIAAFLTRQRQIKEAA